MDTVRHEEYMRRRREAEQQPMTLGDILDEALDRKPPDMVNRPPHYNTTGITECIDAIQAATGEGFSTTSKETVLKYLWRYSPSKGKSRTFARPAGYWTG